VWVVPTALLLSYLLLGTACLTLLEPEWEVIDALYFCLVSVSTVGYGCISPSSDASRRFTFAYLVLAYPTAIAVFSYLTGSLFLLAVDAVGRVLSRSFMAAVQLFHARPIEKVPWIDRLYRDDERLPPGPFFFYLRGIAGLVLCIYATLLLSALTLLPFAPDAFANSLADPESHTGLSFFDSVYYELVTASAVGYGDVCPAAKSARGMMLVHLPLASACTGALLTRASELVTTRSQQLLRARQLFAEQDENLIASLDKNGDGVDKLEFLCGMLIKCDLAPCDDIKKILDRFNALDRDGSGRLTRNDLITMFAGERQEYQMAVTAARRGTLLRSVTSLNLAGALSASVVAKPQGNRSAHVSVHPSDETADTSAVSGVDATNGNAAVESR